MMWWSTTALNPELGGDEAFQRLCDALAAADMDSFFRLRSQSHRVSSTPTIHGGSTLWNRGKFPYAATFDIDWRGDAAWAPPRRDLIPILGRSYGEALEHGEIALDTTTPKAAFPPGITSIDLPIGQTGTARCCRRSWAEADASDEPPGRELLGLATDVAARTRPSRSEAPAFKAELSAITGAKEIIDRGLRAYQPIARRTGSCACPASPARAPALPASVLAAGWGDLNYRRFFDVNTLAGLRWRYRRLPAIHALIGRLIAKGCLHGLRSDTSTGYATRIDISAGCSGSSMLFAVRKSSLCVIAEKILPMASASRALPGSPAPPVMNG